MIYLQTILIMLGLMAVFMLVRGAARSFARRHPEFGMFREEGEGCGCGSKRCGETQCKRDAH